MSRGPGALQRSILEVLESVTGAQLPWRELKRRFPVEVKNKNFYRALRSLRRMGQVQDVYLTDGRRRYVRRTYPARVGEVTYLFGEDVDRILAGLRKPQRESILAGVIEDGGAERAPHVVA